MLAIQAINVLKCLDYGARKVLVSFLFDLSPFPSSKWFLSSLDLEDYHTYIEKAHSLLSPLKDKWLDGATHI